MSIKKSLFSVKHIPGTDDFEVYHGEKLLCVESIGTKVSFHNTRNGVEKVYGSNTTGLIGVITGTIGPKGVFISETSDQDQKGEVSESIVSEEEEVSNTPEDLGKEEEEGGLDHSIPVEKDMVKKSKK